MPASSKKRMKKIFLLLKVGKLSCYSNQKSEKKKEFSELKSKYYTVRTLQQI